jgi:hypothetical protein
MAIHRVFGFTRRREEDIPLYRPSAALSREGRGLVLLRAFAPSREIFFAHFAFFAVNLVFA